MSKQKSSKTKFLESTKSGQIPFENFENPAIWNIEWMLEEEKTD